MIIQSPDNETLKKYASLKEKKYRRLHGMYLLEGARIVRDAVLSGAVIDKVFVREGSAELPEGFAFPEGAVCIVSERAFGRLCDTETPQGIIAAARIPDCADKPYGARCLILDGISDSGNLGTLIRSAAGFGYNDVFLTGCADAYAPKTVRSTMGGIYKVNIRECGYDILGRLKDEGVQLIAADMAGIDAAALKPGKIFAVCIGGEARGLSPEIRAAADVTVALKQDNIESLNAAVAGSILMYLYK